MPTAKEIEPGSIFFLQDRIGDDRNGMEIRETYYVRDPDEPCRFPHNIRVGRLATVQGGLNDKGIYVPRYKAVLGVPCRDPGEMEGRVAVHRLGNGVWEHLLQRGSSDADAD